VKPLLDIVGRHKRGEPVGVWSLCSAHPLVIEAAMHEANAHGAPLLIEATCNQVNQFGGYTGMQPADFVALVRRIAVEEKLPVERIIFGGDHLGPNPWRSEDAEHAMAKAEAMVAAYVAAGFRKIHLDASMGCAGEPAALDDATTAKRAARLARAAETAAKAAGGEAPLYIIGTEATSKGLKPRYTRQGLKVGGHVTWSADDKQLFFTIDSFIHVLSVDGTDEPKLVGGQPEKSRDPACSPDGKWLAFARRPD